MIVVLLVSSVPVYAMTWRVPSDHPTIQAALTVAKPGDTVLIAPGRYTESVTLKAGIHLRGEPGAILDGQQMFGPLVRAYSGVDATTVFSGFIVRGSRQAGILLNQANPMIRNNIIMDNAGPGVDCAQASPTLMNNVFIENRGGGIVCTYPDTLPVIVYNDFWSNRPANIIGCALGEGNLTVQPDFVDASQGDYRLHVASLLRDAGEPSLPLRDADGSRGDIGIYGGPPLPKESRPHLAMLRAAEENFLSPPLRNSLSTQGLPGIINIPTATLVPSGSIDLNYNTQVDDTKARRSFRNADEEQTFNFAIGLLPRLTIGGRGTVATDTDRDRDVARDISANAQLLVLQEGLWWPSLALGVQDVSGGSGRRRRGARLFHSNYAVLSKTLLGRIRGTVGFGTGPDVLDGPFAGAEVALNRYITLMGEYDTEDWNAGIRIFPLPEAWEAYGIPRPTFDVMWQEDGDVSWGISIRTPLGEAKYQAQQATFVTKRYKRLAQDTPEDTTLLHQAIIQLQSTLVTDGFENVRVALWPLERGYGVVVEYENRRYNRDELDGLGVVLGYTTIQMPPSVTQMSIIIKEVNVPVLQFSIAIDDFLSFLNEEISSQSLQQKIHITQQPKLPNTLSFPETITPIINRSWLKVDTILRPGIETQLLTEIGVADMRFSVLPDSFIQLAPGTVLNARLNIPLVQTPGFLRTKPDPTLDRLVGHQAIRLPVEDWLPNAGALMQMSVGRFSRRDVGVTNEIALSLLEGILLLKSTVARVGPSFADLDRWVALANGRIRYPPWDVTLSVTAGLFLDRDQGVNVDISRFWGNTEVGLFLRHSDRGSLGGIRFGVPLTPAKELYPFRFRPRLPELFAYAQQTTVFTDFNVLRGDIARSIVTGHEVERIYWNRDRLYPAYIQQHLYTLKLAARRWVPSLADH